MGELDDTRAARVAELAGGQHGLVAYGQLLHIGLGRNWIAHKARIGWLHRVHRGVYAVGHEALTEHGKSMAAVLACGPGAHLAIWRAATHWELLQRVPPIIDVVLTGNRTGPRGVRTHQVRNLHENDCTIRHGVPVTTVPRTLLDLAAVANERQLRRAVNEAARQGWLSQRVVEDLIERHRGRKGMTAFRAAVEELSAETRFTLSELEVAFEALCRKHGLPKPVMNREVEGYRVDAHFPGTRLIVEIDSYEYHRTPIEFASDRIRDLELKLKRYEVLRIPDVLLDRDPAAVADAIRQRLEAMR